MEPEPDQLVIEEGDLDTLLTQPRSVLGYAVGMRSQPSGFGDVLSGIMFIAWSGEVSWSTLPMVIGAIVAAALILVACGIVFFSLAPWLGKVETVSRQLWELLVTFSLYPDPLFQGALRLALFTVLPAGFVRRLHTSAHGTGPFPFGCRSAGGWCYRVHGPCHYGV
jgi:ABC-2 type transport system permease protein